MVSEGINSLTAWGARGRRVNLPVPILRLDPAVEGCSSRTESFATDRERVESLFVLYEQLSARCSNDYNSYEIEDRPYAANENPHTQVEVGFRAMMRQPAPFREATPCIWISGTSTRAAAADCAAGSDASAAVIFRGGEDSYAFP